MPGSPVVPDQVDRAVERLDLADEPVAVVQPGSAEPFRNRGTETWRRQQDDVVDAATFELRDELGPHERGLWVSVHENLGSARGHPWVSPSRVAVRP